MRTLKLITPNEEFIYYASDFEGTIEKQTNYSYLMAQLSLDGVSMSVSYPLGLATSERDPSEPSGSETFMFTQLKES